MAAPSNAYLNRSLHTYNNGEVINSRAIVQADKATLLNRFYLDDLLITKDADGNEGFTGLVRVNGGNYKYHNQNRIGSLRTYNSGVQVNYTDAGLNTLGHCAIEHNGIKTFAVNHIKLQTWFKAAFYDGNLEHGYYVWGESDNTWRKIIISQDYQQANLSIYPLEIAYSAYEQPQVIRIKPYVINPEGEMVGEEVAFGGSEAIYQYGALYRNSVCDHQNQTPTEFWMKGNQFQLLDTAAIPQDINSATEIRAYQDDTFNLPIPAGYYAGIAGPEKVFVVDSGGQFTSWIYCQPPQAPKDVAIYLFQEDLGDNNIYYGVSVILNAARTEDVTVIGYIGSFNSQDQQISGSVGDPYFNVTIPAGQTYVQISTTYQAAVGAAYSRPIITSITPAGMTYETFAG